MDKDSGLPFGPGMYEDKTGQWKQADRELRDYINRHLKDKNRPEDLDGLSTKLPRSIQNAHVVGDYDVSSERPKGEHVPCALGRGHRPQHGYVIWCPDQFIRLIGSSCGPNHFAEAGVGAGTFANAHSAYNKIRRHERRIDAIIDLNTRFPVLTKEFEAAQDLKAAREYDRFIYEMQNRMNFAWRTMITVADRHGGAMMIERDSSDSAFRAAGGGGMGQTITEDYDRLSGIKVLNDLHLRPSKMFKTAATRIKNSAKIAAKAAPENLRDKDLKAALREAEGATRAVLKAQKYLHAMRRLTSISSLENLERYLNAITDEDMMRFRAIDKGLQKIDSGGNKSAVTLHGAFDDPEIYEIKKFALFRGIT